MSFIAFYEQKIIHNSRLTGLFQSTSSLKVERASLAVMPLPLIGDTVAVVKSPAPDYFRASRAPRLRLKDMSPPERSQLESAFRGSSLLTVNVCLKRVRDGLTNEKRLN